MTETERLERIAGLAQRTLDGEGPEAMWRTETEALVMIRALATGEPSALVERLEREWPTRS